jgi:hypothetical protein
MMANEYSYGTLKQNLIDGMSKKEFIHLNFNCPFVLVSTAFVFLMSLILDLVTSSYTEFSIVFSGLEYLLAYFVKLVGFSFVCFRYFGKALSICAGISLVWNYRRNY